MIADTAFLIDLMQERRAGRLGSAGSFLAAHRPGLVRTCIICLGEVAVSFPKSAEAWQYFRFFRVYPLHRGVTEAAADIDRELILSGARLGENDNWIAGFALYYREPVISRDEAFDRVAGLRRIAY
jgi:predicted nucleic acid-binding protein